MNGWMDGWTNWCRVCVCDADLAAVGAGGGRFQAMVEKHEKEQERFRREERLMLSAVYEVRHGALGMDAHLSPPP